MCGNRRSSDSRPDRGTDLAALGAQQERERQEEDRRAEAADQHSAGKGRYINGRYHPFNCDCRWCGGGDFT